MKYLLDTNIVSFYIRGNEKVIKRLQKHRPSEVAISSITVFELVYGITRKADSKWRDAVDKFIVMVEVLPFDEAAGTHAGILQAKLEKSGKTGSMGDVLIAGHALSAHCILVTNNTKDFNHIKGLKIEDWTK